MQPVQIWICLIEANPQHFIPSSCLAKLYSVSSFCLTWTFNLNVILTVGSPYECYVFFFSLFSFLCNIFHIYFLWVWPVSCCFSYTIEYYTKYLSGTKTWLPNMDCKLILKTSPWLHCFVLTWATLGFTLELTAWLQWGSFGLAQQHSIHIRTPLAATTTWEGCVCCLVPASKPQKSPGEGSIVSYMFITRQMTFLKKVEFIPLCSLMYNSHSSFMYCKAFQSFKENGSACVFSKHDLFCTAAMCLPS